MKNFLRFLLMLLAFAPLAMQAQFTATFGTGTSSTSSGGQAGSPMSGGTVFSYTQNIYTAAELTAAGVPAGATIIAIDFSNGTGESLVLHNCRTYMTHRSTTNFTSATDYTPYNQLTLVDSSDWVTTGSGWFTVNLHSPFVWNGTGNLLIAVSYGGASLGGSNIGYNYTTQTESRHWRRGCRLNNGPVDAVYASYPEYTSTSTPSGTAFTTLPATSTNRPNLRITYILSGCPSLTPNVANIGPYTADLNWINFQQSVSSWDIMYGVHGAFDTLSGGTTLTSITDTFYTLTGLTSATTYAVYMKPYCSSGTSTWSAPRIFTTTAACPTPTTPVVMSHTADEATISWLPGASETGWEVACVPHGAPVGSVTPDYVTGSPYTIMNLIDNTQYDVYVRADCGNGETSYWTSAATFTTDPYCTAPRNVTVSQVVGSSALVSWQSALVGALDYTVEYSETGQNVWNTSIVNGTSTMLTGLTPQTSYQVRVFSNCSLGDADTIYKSFTTGCLSGGDYTVGTGTLTTYELPINNYWEYSYTQQIFLASEMNGPQSISSVAFQYAYSSPSTVKNSVNIYMGHTTQSTFSSASDYISSSNLTLVYSGNLNCQQGWNTFNFTTPFQYNGTDNLVLVVDDNSGDYNSDSHTFYAHDAGANRAVHYYQDGADISMTSPTSADDYDVTNYRSNVKFGGQCSSTATCIAPNVYISDVTDESITVAWAPGYTENSWNLEYRAGNGAWISEGVVTGSSYTITNLTSNTDYTVRMQSSCGGGDVSDWAMASEHTACSDLTTMPFIDNLDSYTGATTTSVATSNLPDCWSHINEGTSSSYSGYPIIYNNSTYAASGTNSLRFYTYTTAGTYDDQIAILPPIDVTTVPMNTLQVAFDVRALNTSYTFKLDVGIMTDPTDRSTFVTIQSLNITSTTYANYEVPFSQYLGTGKYIAFKASKPTSGYNYGYVDNIRVEPIPACPKPTNVTSNGVTTSSVTLGWTEVGSASSWEIAYGPAGFTPGTAAGTTEIVYTNPYTVTGLSASSNYDFYVRSDCGGDYSNYSNAHTVSTQCDLVTVLPLMENFDSHAGATTTSMSANNLPNCWSHHNTGTSTSYSGYPIIYNSSTYAASGTNAMRFYMYSTAGTYSDQIAILPPVDVNVLPVNTLQLSFDARRLSSSYPFNLVVGVMTDPTNASTFVPVQTISVPGTTYTNYLVPFTQYTDTGAYIAIKGLKPSSSYNEGYVDNVVLDLAPLCERPTHVMASNLTATTADIDWIPGGNETNWEVVVVPTGSNVLSGIPEPVTTHPYTLTNLNASTAYDVYVHADCGTGTDFSSWSQVCTFSTTALCTPPTNVEVSQIAGTSALVTWTEAVFGANAYTLSYTEAGQSSWITQSVTGNNYMITGLTPQTSYTVTIVSECTEGTAPTVTRNFTTGCLSGGDNIVGTGTTTSYNIPLNTFYNYSYTQQLFLANEINYSGGIHSIGFQYIYSTAQTKNNQSIYLAETDLNSLSTWIPADSLTLVYNGSVTYNNIGPDNWVTITLDSVFNYSGTRNLVVVVKNDHGSYSTSSNNTFKTHSASNMTLQYYNDSNPFSMTSPASATTYSYRNNIKFGADCDNTVTCIAPNVYVSDVTETSITLNWAPGNNESSWELETSTNGTTWTPEGTVTAAPYIFTNLTPNTLYYFRMRSDCGGGEYSTWTSLNVRTACAAISTVPYMENFDSHTGATTTSVSVNNLPNCWGYLNAGTSTSYSGYPIIYNSSSYAASGTNAMRFYTYTTANTYDDQIAILPEIDVTTLPINTLQLTFDARDNTTSYPFNLEIGVMTDPTDKTTFALVSTITTSSTTYANYEIPLSQYNGSGAYIAIKAPQPAANYNYGYVDNVKIELIPSCPKPTQVHASNVTTNTVDLGWTENGTATAWEIEYGPAGFTLGNGTTENATTNPYTISGLTASTTYDFYVRSDCGGQYSNYSTVLSTATACDAIAQLPYTENFDSYGTGESAYPNCWGKINTYSSNRPYVHATHYAGVGSLYFYAGTSGTYNIAVTPPFDATIPVNTLQATLMYRSTYASDMLIVGVMTNPTDASTFVPVDTIHPATSYTTWVEREVNFSQYQGTGQYIAFKNAYTTTGGYGYMDNLVIDLIPACPKPNQVHVVSASTTSLELGWTENGTATSWVIEYGPTGFTPGNGTTENASTNPYTINGLTASTQYDFYIKSDCGSGDYSTYSAVFTAATECDAVVQLPYTENFDTYGTGESAYPNCWSKINTYSANRPYVNSTHYAGVGSLYFYAGSGTYNIAVVPQFDASIPINTLQATFMYRTSSTTDYMIVGVMTNAADASTFVPVDTVYPASTASTWVEKEVVFNGYTGAGHYIAFYNGKPSTTCYSYIDNLSIDLIPACPKPQNLHAVDATVSSIELGWTEVGTATSWEIVYGAPGFDPNGAAATSVTATSNPYTITGLNSSTTYEFYVRSLCGGTDVSYWSTGVQVSTTMTPEPLPYTADFSTNDAWVLNNGSCTNYWMKGTVSGTPALFVTDNGSTPNYTITSTSVVAAQKLFTIGTADTLTITFDVQVQGESSFDYMKLFLAPASQQFPASTTAPGSNDYGYNTYSTNAYNFYAHNYGGESSSYPHILNQVSGTIHVVAKMPNPNTNPNANSTALMVFAWKNDPSVGTQPPATITNLSVTASGTAPVTCDAPTGVTASNVTQTSATITWTAGGTETAWELQYKTASASNWSNSINVTNTPSHNLTGLTAGTQYQVRVRAVCSATETSNWSSVGTFTTTQASVTPPTVTTNNATNVSLNSATLNGTITPGSETITAQGFEWKATTGGTYTAVNATGTTLSYNLTGLTANTGYTFRAFATTASGTTYGAEKTFITTEETCAAPTNVTASNITNTTAEISWTQQGDVTSWDVNYRVAGATSWYSATTTTNPYMLSGLTESTTYEVQVIAHCTNGVTSDPSATITLTTVGINDYELNNVVVYPNPTTGMIQIQNSESRIENVEVYDAYGKMLNAVTVNDNATSLDLSGYASGTYFVKIMTENGVVTKRVVKQ